MQPNVAVTEHGEKQVSIIINATEHMVSKEDISHEQVATLAFPEFAGNPEVTYTIKYKPSEGAAASEILPPGALVKVHKGMVFNVRHSGQS